MFPDMSVKHFQGIRAKVCKIPFLPARPDVFYGIQLRRVCGKPLDGKPVPLGFEKGARFAGLVRRQSVPEEDELPAHMSPKFLNRADNLVGAHAAFENAQEELRTIAPRRRGDGPDDRANAPASRGSYDRRPAPRRPRPANRRPFRHARFVPKADPRARFQPLFWMRGQVTSRQRWIARSSRSLALVSGFWQLQPMAASTFQT